MDMMKLDIETQTSKKKITTIMLSVAGLITCAVLAGFYISLYSTAASNSAYLLKIASGDGAIEVEQPEAGTYSDYSCVANIMGSWSTEDGDMEQVIKLQEEIADTCENDKGCPATRFQAIYLNNAIALTLLACTYLSLAIGACNALFRCFGCLGQCFVPCYHCAVMIATAVLLFRAQGQICQYNTSPFELSDESIANAAVGQAAGVMNQLAGAFGQQQPVVEVEEYTTTADAYRTLRILWILQVVLSCPLGICANYALNGMDKMKVQFKK